MPFQPYSETEASAARCAPAGTYDFEVLEAVEKTSKSGNDMIEVTLSLFVGEARMRVTDWLLSTPRWAFKVRHFAETCGILEQYESGEFCAALCVGHCGRVQIRIEENEQYGARNRVKDYGEAQARDEPPRHKNAIGDPKTRNTTAKRDTDDIPF